MGNTGGNKFSEPSLSLIVACVCVGVCICRPMYVCMYVCMYTLKSEVLNLAPMKCTVGDCTSGAILTPEEVLRFQHHRSANQVLNV